jgi:hypothetical protein
MNTKPTRIGYTRTSPTDQKLDAQILALTAAGCSMIRTEQKSIASVDARPELKTILDLIHPGETLVVTRIDRLAQPWRSTDHRRAAEIERRASGRDRKACRYLRRGRQDLLRHAGRLCRIRNQPAPRTPGQRLRRRPAPRDLFGPPPEDRHSRHPGQTGAGPVPPPISPARWASREALSTRRGL